MGRKKLPTAVKELKGTAQPSRLNKSEPKVIATSKPASSWLSPRAKRVFAELKVQLDTMKVMSESDVAALEMLCDAYDEYRQARAKVKKEGNTYTTITKAGDLMIRQRPEVAIASDAYKRVRSMMTEFGLTPSSRAKVNASDGDEVDPIKELLKFKEE